MIVFFVCWLQTTKQVNEGRFSCLKEIWITANSEVSTTLSQLFCWVHVPIDQSRRWLYQKRQKPLHSKQNYKTFELILIAMNISN